MGIISKFFGKKKSDSSKPEEQTVLIELDGVNLPDEVYEEYDLYQLEEILTEALGGSGEYDGNETGPQNTTVFLYGEDAEAMFAKIEAELSAYPLAKGAVVTIRKGGPGSPERRVKIV